MRMCCLILYLDLYDPLTNGSTPIIFIHPVKKKEVPLTLLLLKHLMTCPRLHRKSVMAKQGNGSPGISEVPSQYSGHIATRPQPYLIRLNY